MRWVVFCGFLKTKILKKKQKIWYDRALPALVYFGKNKIHKQVIDEIKSGDKLISLAISELRGASDVANLETMAVKDGNDYIVNGNKYWVS